MDRSFMCISCRIACVRDACLSCESDDRRTPSDVPPDERRRDAGLFKYLTRNNWHRLEQRDDCDLPAAISPFL